MVTNHGKMNSEDVVRIYAGTLSVEWLMSSDNECDKN